MVRFSVAMGMIAALVLAQISPAAADDGFPFGAEMTLDAPPMRGSKRIPNLEIGDKGEIVLQLWCKSGKAQFSVAGPSVIFLPADLSDSGCTPERAEADDALMAVLLNVSEWKRRGSLVSFAGPQGKPLRFRINTN